MKTHIIYKNIIFFAIFSLINGGEQFYKDHLLTDNRFARHICRVSDQYKVGFANIIMLFAYSLMFFGGL